MNQAEFAEQVAAGFGDAQSMAEVTATPGGGSWLPSLGQMGDLLRRGDLALAIGVDARVGRQGRAALAGSAAAHVGVDHCRYDAGNPLRA
jgi:hypothetical protein